MIIECQACRARFKLDESRIKGKGARIRCRKCGESIIVMKGEIPAEKPSAPVGKELFDLRSVLREPERRAAAPSKNKVDATFETPLRKDQEKELFDLRSVLREPERRAAAPSKNKVDATFETPLRKDQEPDPAAQESAEPPRGTASEVGEEVEAAFDRLLDRDREREVAAQESAESYPEVPPSPAAVIDAPVESPLDREQKGEPEPPSVVAEAPVSADREPDVAARELAESFAEVSPPYLEEVDASFDTPLFGEEVHSPPKNGKLLAGDFREPSEKDPRAATILGEEEPEADRKPLEFLVLDTDSSDMLNKDRTLQEPPKSFDISEQLSQAPRWALEEDPAPTPPTPQPDPLPGAADDLRANKIQEELAGLGERNLREEIFGPEPPPPDLSPPKPLKMERKPLMAPRASKPSRRPSVTLLALLFATLAAAGAYLAFTKSGRETLRAILPGMESFWLGGRESARRYTVENPIGFYESGKDSEKIFVIKGAVTNQGRTAKSGIRVRAELFDIHHKSIGELTVYAGNVIHEWRSETRESIQAQMSNRFGDKLSNVDVAPGKSVPFMVVFIDPPEGIEEYRLETLEGE